MVLGTLEYTHTSDFPHLEARRISVLIQDQQWLQVPIFSPRNPKKKLILASILALRLLEHANEERTLRILRTEFKEIER